MVHIRKKWPGRRVEDAFQAIQYRVAIYEDLTGACHQVIQGKCPLGLAEADLKPVKRGACFGDDKKTS